VGGGEGGNTSIRCSFKLWYVKCADCCLRRHDDLQHTMLQKEKGLLAMLPWIPRRVILARRGGAGDVLDRRWCSYLSLHVPENGKVWLRGAPMLGGGNILLCRYSHSDPYWSHHRQVTPHFVPDTLSNAKSIP